MRKADDTDYRHTCLNSVFCNRDFSAGATSRFRGCLEKPLKM